jgi:hypothetical protein
MDLASEAVGAAASAASEVNARIREVAESLAGQGDDDHAYTFFCECGCLKPITLTLAAFLAKGALLDEHRLADPS